MTPKTPAAANGEGSESQLAVDGGTLSKFALALQIPPIIARRWWRPGANDNNFEPPRPAA